MTTIIAVGLIVLASILLLVFSLLSMRWKSIPVRKLPQMERLEMAHNLNLETGQQFVFVTGRGLLKDENNTGTLMSLPLLRWLSAQAVLSDHPPLVISGDGSLALMSKMILSGAYQNALIPNLFYRDFSHTTGDGRFSYLAGCLPELLIDQVGMLVLAGSINPEMFLLTDLAARKDILSLAASDNVAAQAVLLANNEMALIGEEYYGIGSTPVNSRTHVAALHTQDVLRVLIVLTIIVASILKAVGIY